MADVRYLLFDMDNVLCDYDRAERLRILEDATGVAAADIDAQIFQSGFEDKADLGHYGPGPYVEEISRLLDVDMDAETWLAARSRAMTPWPEMLALARDMKTRRPVALLSNNSWLLRENIGRILPELPEIFAGNLYFSAEIGLGKETPDVFAPLLGLLGWTAAETLFIDDSPDYIASAAAAGLQTHLFTGADDLRGTLAALGLT